MNFTSSNFCRRRQFSANDTQPAPLSPSPWAMITVAVCFLTAGTIRAVGGGIVAAFGLSSLSRQKKNVAIVLWQDARVCFQWLDDLVVVHREYCMEVETS
jgi:hypothetical protein